MPYLFPISINLKYTCHSMLFYTNSTSKSNKFVMLIMNQSSYICSELLWCNHPIPFSEQCSKHNVLEQRHSINVLPCSPDEVYPKCTLPIFNLQIINCQLNMRQQRQIFLSFVGVAKMGYSRNYNHPPPSESYSNS